MKQIVITAIVTAGMGIFSIVWGQTGTNPVPNPPRTNPNLPNADVPRIAQPRISPAQGVAPALSPQNVIQSGTPQLAITPAPGFTPAFPGPSATVAPTSTPGVTPAI